MPRISKADACTLIQRYRDTGGWDDGQTKSTWLSNDNLTEIMNMLAEYGADGVHIYLARYPKTEMPGAPDPVKYKDRITVVFVPTVNKQDIFNVEDPPGKSTNANAALMPPPPPPDDLAYDHTSLEP